MVMCMIPKKILYAESSRNVVFLQLKT